MKKQVLSAAAFLLVGSAAHAQAAGTGNMTLATDYRFRGISQTFRQPTVQGGIDYAHASDFYLGNWNSNVSGVQYPDGAGLEMDFYGGYKFAPAAGLTLDLGLLKYYYPGARVGGIRPDALEIYLGANYKWFSARYSHAVDSDYFGYTDARASSYLDLGAAFEVAEKITLGLHLGRQRFGHAGAYDYTDYRIAVARDCGWATLSLALAGSNADDALYTVANASGKTRNIGAAGAVLSLSKTF